MYKNFWFVCQGNIDRNTLGAVPMIMAKWVLPREILKAKRGRS